MRVSRRLQREAIHQVNDADRVAGVQAGWVKVMVSREIVDRLAGMLGSTARVDEHGPAVAGRPGSVLDALDAGGFCIYWDD